MAQNVASLGLLVAILLISQLVTAFAEQCECPLEIAHANNLGATYTSPNYPISYCVNLTCNYEIVPRKNWAVVLEVEHLDTEEQEDFLEISQTAKDQNGKLHRLSGTRLSGKLSTQRTFYSSIGGGFHLFFKSDGRMNIFAGFKASFNRVRTRINMTDAEMGVLLRYEFLSGSNLHTAVQSLNDAHGFILVALEKAAEWYARFELGNMAIDDGKLNETISINYSRRSQREYACPQPLQVADTTWRSLPAFNFPVDSTCAFQINSTGPGVTVEIRNMTNGTTLEFRDEKLFKRFAGSAQFQPPPQFDSRTSSVTVLMTSAPGASYDVRFKSGLSICTCPTELIQLYGNESHAIASPAFPLDYCNSADCKTHVRIAPTFSHNDSVRPVVRVTFDTFHLQEERDFLEMSCSNWLISLTDMADSIRHFTFDQSDVNLRFVTDNMVTMAGFNLYTEAYVKPNRCECPGSADLCSSERIKYAFDEDCGHMDCFWEILPYDWHQKLSLTIGYHISAPTEFIRVSNGATHVRLEASTDGQVERQFNFENVARVNIWYHREDDMKGGRHTIDLSCEWE